MGGLASCALDPCFDVKTRRRRGRMTLWSLNELVQDASVTKIQMIAAKLRAIMLDRILPNLEVIEIGS